MQPLAVLIRRAPQGLLLAALLGGGASARAATPAWVPPAPRSMVTDRAGVLSPGVGEALAASLEAYQRSSGHQLLVWIDRSSGAVPIEQFAVEAFAAWKIGRKGLDDGLAVFAMTEDRAIRIEVGYGLEPTITDLVADRVIRNTMIPRIRAGDWDTAIHSGVGALVATIEDSAESAPGDAAGGDAEEPALDLWWQIGLGLFGVVFLFLLITNPRRALMLLWFIGRSGASGFVGGGFGGGGGGGGFRGGGGRSGGGGATGHW